MTRDYSSVLAVYPLQQYTLTNVNIALDEFVIAGDQRERFLVAGKFVVIDSTGNDGTFTAATVTFAASETTIGVNEDITDATVDGRILNDQVADQLGMTLAHDDSTDRDAETPDQIAGAHIQRLTNEIRALGRTLGTGIGFEIIDDAGLDVLFSSGTIIFGSGPPNEGVPGKLTMADDETNFVEVDSSAAITSNTTAFSDGKYPLAIVTTVAGDITDIANKRSAIYIAEFAENIHAFGGSQHTASALAAINALINDATLDDVSGTRDPNAHTHAAADVVSGTFADALIAESNVTQHQAAIDHDALTNFTILEHRIINDAGNSTTELLSSSKILADIAAVSAGIDLKDPVATSTEGLGNITLSGEQTLNNVTTSASRVMVMEQTLGEENGPYLTAAGAWTRTTDADTDAKVTNGLTVDVVDSGSTVFRHRYVLTTSDPITVGTTPLTFSTLPGVEFGTTAGTSAEGNDSRIPTQDENDALVGTNGTPSTANKYVTDSDPRLASPTHDGDTLQHDGVNSDGGAFPFDTTGTVTYNQDQVISKVSPEHRLNDTGQTDFTRLTIIEAGGVSQRRSIVNEPAGLGSLIDFDGEPTDDEIRFGDVTQLQYDFDEPFSIIFIARPDNISSRNVPISKNNPISPFNGWNVSFAQDGSGSLSFEIIQTITTKQFKVKTPNGTFLADGTKYHIAITYDGSNTVAGIRIYVDGVNQSLTVNINNPMDGTISNTNDFTIGAFSNLATLHYDGGLDEIVLYDNERTSGQVAADFNGGAYTNHAPETGLDAIYHCNEGSGTSLGDSSGNGFNSTSFVNTPTFITPGFVAIPGTDVERSLWKMEDGVCADEAGILTVGDTDTRHTLEGKTIRFNINGVEKFKIDENGRFDKLDTFGDLTLKDGTTTADGAMAFDRTNEDLSIGDGSASQIVHMGAWKTWVPVFAGFSADPTVNAARFSQVGKICVARLSTGNGTSNATTFTITLPVAASSTVIQNLVVTRTVDNGNGSSDQGLLQTQLGSATADVFVNAASAAWTASGGKKVDFTIVYETD